MYPCLNCLRVSGASADLNHLGDPFADTSGFAALSISMVSQRHSRQPNMLPGDGMLVGATAERHSRPPNAVVWTFATTPLPAIPFVAALAERYPNLTFELGFRRGMTMAGLSLFRTGLLVGRHEAFDAPSVRELIALRGDPSTPMKR
jgi:hypothetical protein